MTVNLIITVSWVAFIVLWVGAGIRYHSTRSPGKADRKGAAVCLFAAVLFLVITRLTHANLTVQTNLLLAWTGAILTAAGIGLAFWARFYLASSWGMPMTKAAAPRLVTAGIYHWIRHPIYSGILLALAGTALASSWLLFIPFGILAVYFVYAARQEEIYLSSELGSEYETYRHRTKMLVPFVL